MTLVTAWLNKYYIKGPKVTGNIQMKPVFKLEGVTRTAVNLENYSKKEVCGQTRALHVSIKQDIGDTSSNTSESVNVRCKIK